MRIPRSAVIGAPEASLFGLLSLFSKDGKYKTGDWSSLIGIVTAICGNVLISVALNTQRYAHIKLGQQYQERQRLLRRAQKRARKAQQQGEGGPRFADEGYGAARTSTERKKRGSLERYMDDPEEGDATEDEPLLMSASMHSDVTTETNGVPEDGGQEEEQATEKSYLKSPYWWAGIVLMTIGEAGNFLAYGFAPASIVSPLGVVALISNCIIAPFFLKEQFRKRDFLGVLIAVGGAVTVVLSASDSNPKLGPNEIWKLISTWEFETYFGITLAMMVVLMWASSRYGDKSIFIDLGLVGLFGRSPFPDGTFDYCCADEVLLQAAILLCLRKASRLCSRTRFLRHLRSRSRISWLRSWWARQSCRSSMSTGLCGDSMRPR